MWAVPVTLGQPFRISPRQLYFESLLTNDHGLYCVNFCYASLSAIQILMILPQLVTSCYNEVGRHGLDVLLFQRESSRRKGGVILISVMNQLKRNGYLSFLIGFIFCVAFAVGTQADDRSFTVMTYNIHHGERLDGVIDLAGQARYMLSTGADIIGLQEVDVGTARTARVDQAAFLSQATGYEVVFTPHFDYQGGQYGLALLSRYPIVHHESHPLPTALGAEPKSMLQATIDVQGTLIDIFVVHLEVRETSVRNAQAARAAEIIEQSTRPAIIMGDFNGTSDSPVTLPLRYRLIDTYVASRMLSPVAAWSEDPAPSSYTAGGATWPVIDPRNRGDFIWHTAEFTPVRPVQAPEVYWSDHRPVIATFRIEGALPQAAPLPTEWESTDRVAIFTPPEANPWYAAGEIDPMQLAADVGRWLENAGFHVLHVMSLEQVEPGSVILLPAGRNLTWEQLDALQRHLAAGGAVLAWGDTGLEDPLGRPVREAFQRLFGIRYVGWSYGYPTRDGIALDMEAVPWPTDMPEVAKFWELASPIVQCLPGARILGTWRNASDEPSHTPELNAAIVQNGRALYLAALAYHPWDPDNPDMRALVTGLVRYLAGNSL